MPSRRRANRESFSTSQIGAAVGTSNSKTNTVTDLNGTARATRTLRSLNLTNIPQYSTGSQVNTRVRDIIRFSGVKVSMEWRNLTDSVLQCHVAVLAPTAAVNVGNGDFFRDNTTESRSVDFSSALSSTEFMNLPIKTDRYTILLHKRFLLGRALTEAVQGDNVKGDANYRTFQKYFKINRQIRYEDTSTPRDGNIYLVWWADNYLTAAGTAAVPNAFQCNAYCTQYFRETPNY